MRDTQSNVDLLKLKLYICIWTHCCFPVLPRHQTQSSLCQDLSVLLDYLLPPSSSSRSLAPSPPSALFFSVSSVSHLLPSCPCLKHLCQLCLSLPLSSSLIRSARLTSLHLSFLVSSSISRSAQREAYYYHSAHNHCKQQALFVSTFTSELSMPPLLVCSCSIHVNLFYFHIFIKKYVNQVLLIHNKKRQVYM